MQVVQTGNEVAWMNQGKEHRGTVQAIVPAGESATQYTNAPIAPVARYARVVVLEGNKFYAPPMTTVQKGLSEARIYQELGIFDEVKNQVQTVKNEMIEKMKIERRQSAAVEKIKASLAKASKELANTRTEIEDLRHRAACFMGKEQPAPVQFPVKPRATRGSHPDWLDPFLGTTFSFEDVVKRYPDMKGTTLLYNTVYYHVNKSGMLKNVGKPGAPRFTFSDDYLIKTLPASS